MLVDEYPGFRKKMSVEERLNQELQKMSLRERDRLIVSHEVEISRPSQRNQTESDMEIDTDTGSMIGTPISFTGERYDVKKIKKILAESIRREREEATGRKDNSVNDFEGAKQKSRFEEADEDEEDLP